MRPLPDYELVRKLGAGGFGEVWHARGPGSLDVALKFIKLAAQGSGLEVRALEVMKNIRHPNLVSLFGVWERDDLLILAMELCDRSLLDRLKEALAQNHPGIPVADLLSHMRDAASGLDALNAKHVQHRDVKPLNLLLLDRSVKVADFGLAKLLEATVVSHTGAMTIAYAAPECFRGEVTSNSDQYSLAVTYFHLRTGRLLFGGSPERVLYRHLHEEPNLTPLAPGERAVLSRALAKEAGERWTSCQEFVTALSDALSGDASEGSLAQPTLQPYRDSGETAATARASKAKHRRLWPVAVSLLLLLPLLLLLAGYLGGMFPKSQQERTGTGNPNPPDQDLTEPNQPEPMPVTWPATLAIDLGDGVTMEFVLIDPKSKPDRGTFQMGDARWDDEQLHPVRIVTPYYLGKYVVTQQQYKQTTGTNPSYFRAGGGGAEKLRDMNTTLFPVENVSWIMADAFCKELMKQFDSQLPAELQHKGYHFALPTEAQWEYACRAGTRTQYFFGDDVQKLAAHGWFADNSGGRTHAVTAKDTQNPWGLYGMHGNVWEWCADWYGPYDDLPKEDPFRSVKYSENRRVLRGGSWFSNAWDCRAPSRFSCAPDGAYLYWGFRVGVRLD
jgi:formylglycine-generating enzyme required for sulfatase activity/serine/threonine protein kinase